MGAKRLERGCVISCLLLAGVAKPSAIVIRPALTKPSFRLNRLALITLHQNTMGQYWDLINLDKEERLEGVYGKWSDLYFHVTQTDIHVLASDNPWAGDGIILRAYDTSYFPPGVLTEEDDDLNRIGLRNFRNVSYADVTVDWMPSDGENTIVLRNFNAREYITNRLFPRKLILASSCFSTVPDLLSMFVVLANGLMNTNFRFNFGLTFGLNFRLS
jgi:hypothetical protein